MDNLENEFVFGRNGQQNMVWERNQKTYVTKSQKEHEFAECHGHPRP